MRMFKLAFVFLFLFSPSCKSRKEVDKSVTQQSQGENAKPGLGLYSVGISIGDADFVLIRDCDSKGQCKNDIQTAEDDLQGNNDMMEINFTENDPNFLQIVACKDKTKITDPASVEAGLVSDKAVAHVVTELTIDKVVYKCVVSKVAKEALQSLLAQNPNPKGLNLDGDSNSNSNSDSGDNIIVGVSAGVLGFTLGFAAGFAIVKAYDSQQKKKFQEKLKVDGKDYVVAVNERRTKDKFASKEGVDRVLITDFDGTLGLGDYDPHPEGYAPEQDGGRNMTKQEWKDFCERKIGGAQGLKEFREKFKGTQDAHLTPVEIVEKGLIPELDGLKGKPGSTGYPTFNELVEQGHMVKAQGADGQFRFFNSPTWLAGSVDVIKQHIEAGHLIIFNSTNFRPGAKELIEASLMANLQKSGLDQGYYRNPDRTPLTADKAGRGTKTGLKGVYIGTTAALGLGSLGSRFDGVNAAASWAQVGDRGDKAAIMQVAYADAMDDGLYVKKGTHIVSIDDKPGKAKEFAQFARDVGGKHIFIQSKATKVKSNLTTATEHIEASLNVLHKDSHAFDVVKEGKTEVVLAEDRAVRDRLIIPPRNALSFNEKLTITPSEKIGSLHAVSSRKGMLAGAVLGVLMGTAGGVLGGILSK